uniref:Putative AAA family ATPase y4kL n=1 Tax=Talaromyces marneffei PM1 TaxID=1077442 RepID=A0A093VE36_TALMA
MASSSHDSKTQAQVATPPDSPHQETQSREKRDSQLYANAIRGLFADKKRDISPTGPDSGSEPVTVNQLNGLLEAALASKGSGIGHASLEQGGDNTTHDTSDTYGNLQAWDAVTEIDDCPQELYRFSRTGLDARSVEATTPPHSPRVAPSDSITKEELKWMFAEVLGIQSAQSTPDGKDSACNDKPEEQDNDRARIRASKAEYKTVNEVWDSAKYEYKVIHSAPVPDVDELDEYIFVIRKRSHKQTKELIVYVDIKSLGLRDILKEVLKDIRTANLDADRPAIERDLLYHYLDELKDRQKRLHSQEATPDDAMLHLSKLIQHLEETYAPVVEQLKLLQESQKITWDLVWSLLKPGTLVFATCPSTGLPRCIRYDYLEKKTIRGREFLEVNGRYLDYDGEVFGESTETLQIGFFRGAKQIQTLPVYPLHYHTDPNIWSRLVCNGRHFVSLIGSHHREYCGNMFIPDKNRLLKFHMHGRIMVDAAIFRKTNPNYPRLEIKKPDTVDFFFEQVKQGGPESRIRGKDIDFSAMKEEDLAIFPEDKKKVIKSLAESRVSTRKRTRGHHSLTTLMKMDSGPPGVGKTLTAEAISERLQRPLYSISSGDLSIRAEELEAQLTRTFQVASDWKAVLLLDEADVYLQKRDGFHLERNRLVATFLRTLEYYDGIFFLTTNMLGDFDSAILDRIQLKLQYDDLDRSARKSVFQHFLREHSADIEDEVLTQFSEVKLNGRQIKNIVKIAHNVAMSDNTGVCTSHLRLALTQSGYSIPQGVLASDDNLYHARLTKTSFHVWSSERALSTQVEMSQKELHEIRKRLEEAERRREEAERRQQEEQQRREEAERRQEEEQRRREEAERNLNLEILQTRSTTLPEFLDACHEHLFLGLTIQKDKKSSTKGDPANADRKLRPSRIQEWTDFPDEQMAIWRDLMDADFVTERHFTPLLALKEFGNEVRDRMLSSELDLGYFQRHSVESRVASVIKQLHANPQLKRRFHLNGDVTFENHANTLTDESRIVTDMGSLNLGQEGPRRSERLARRSRDTSRSTSRMRRQTTAQPRPPRSRADQFCVYNRGPDEKVPSFLIEYKAPHKLSLAHIKAGLQDMELDRIVRYQKDESPEDICRRVVAAVVTQLSNYMYDSGNEYGCIATGEAFIFLRVPHHKPSTVLYYLSVPKEDVGNTTNWPRDDNRLHLTAVGQLLAFTLRALRTSPRDIAWRSWARSQLGTWEMVYDDLLEEIEEKDIPTSDYKPSLSQTNYYRQSPVKTRSKSTLATSYPSTPSRAPRDFRLLQRPATAATTRISTRSQQPASKGKSRKYCTQQCLRGLRGKGPLDRKCPNASEHGTDRHQLNTAMLIKLLDRQLSEDPDPNKELGCESLHIHGTRGALFKITLWSHGYTFVGKGVPIEFIECARQEEVIYSHLRAIQGQYVPIVFGGIDLRRPVSYDGIAEMVRLTLMSYAGRNLTRHEMDQAMLIAQAETSLRAIHHRGVLHSDPIPGNMVWNEENQRVMFIDFERAQYQRRTPLGPIAANQKRKRVTTVWDKSPNKRPDSFQRELSRMRSELRY